MWEGSVKQYVYSTVKSTLQNLIAIATMSIVFLMYFKAIFPALIVVYISKYILVDVYYVR